MATTMASKCYETVLLKIILVPLISPPSPTYGLTGMAKMSFAPEHLDNPDMSKLNDQDREVLKDWADKMEKKYPVVGTIACSAL